MLTTNFKVKLKSIIGRSNTTMLQETSNSSPNDDDTTGSMINDISDITVTDNSTQEGSSNNDISTCSYNSDNSVSIQKHGGNSSDTDDTDIRTSSTPQPQKKIPCTQDGCPTALSNNGNLKRHLRLVHKINM